MARIVVVGSLNVDVSVRAHHLPAAGETVRADDLLVGPGGKGLNQAVGAARLGAEVLLVGAVGDDAFAGIPGDTLRREGIDATHVARLAGQATGAALITIDAASGENTIAVAAGANRAVAPEAVWRAADAFANAGALMVQLELPLETVDAALRIARAHGVPTLLDPAPARDLPDDLLRNVDYITPNETEAAFLSGRAATSASEAEAAARAIAARTGGQVLVTLGAAGCVHLDGEGRARACAAPAVKPVDTTGAGDAFNAGLAHALASGASVEDAVGRALRNGSAATLARGAAAAMPRPEDLERL